MELKAKILDLRNDNRKIIYTIFVTAILSRLLIFLVSLLMLRYMHIDIDVMEHLSQMGDVPRYNNIAEFGYAASGEDAKNIVFYPLFPFLTRLFHIIFRDYTVSGIIISYLCFGFASVYLYKLARLDYSHEKAVDALLLFYLAPYGMFFMSAHTESLFVMLSVISLYYSRRENWLAASVAGFCAALTKTQGVLLIVPVAYELILCCVRDKRFNKKGLYALLIPLGLAVYLCINKVVQGDFFAFVEHQAVAPWYNTATWVSNSLATSYKTGIEHFSLAMIIYWPQIILFFVAVAGVLFGLKKNVRTSYLAFMGIYTLATYFHGWMLSGARYLTSCVIAYIIMASVDNKLAKYLMYLISGILTMYYASMWLQGYAIM